MRDKTFLIMAGGTGGHVFPALAVAQSLMERHDNVAWLGSKGGMEEGIVTKASLSGFTVMFSRAGELEFSRLTDEFEVIEEAESTNNETNLTLDDVEKILSSVLEKYNGVAEDVDLGEKWIGGKVVLHPADEKLQSKEIPVEAFFRKIVMVRERLRVLEQNINNHKKLNDEDRIHLQQYITKSYGSLTSFNVLFKNKEDYFKGTGT